MLTYCTQQILMMINRQNPQYNFYKLISNRTPEDPFVLSKVDGQVFIGLKETTEFSDGSKAENFIEFDPSFINSKVDFYDNASLVARKNLP